MWPRTLLLPLLVWLECLRLGDAAINSASVSPASLSAGDTGTVNVAFTTGTTVPVGGAIVITFPSTFYVDAASALSQPVGIDSGSTAVATPSSGVVTITIANTDATAGSISFTLDSISNPGMGTSSSYSIVTESPGGATLESATVPGSTFYTGSIANTAQMTAASLVAGWATSYTMTFTTGVTVRIGGMIVLQFPTLSYSQIVFTGATLSNLANINTASTVVQVASPYLRLTVAGQDIAAGTTVSVMYSNIINPAIQTSSFYFGVHTRHPSGAILQENQAVPGLTYTAGTLPSATVTPVSYFAGITTDYNVVFANSAYLPPGSQVMIVFPNRFDISGVKLAYISNMPTVNTVLDIYNVNTARVTTGNTAVVPGTGRGFTLQTIVNPGTSCDEFIVEYCTTVWETYSVSIVDSGGNLFESLTAVPGTPIVKKPLSFGQVRPLLKTPNTLTVATVILDTEATIPLGGFIEAVLPADYSVGSAPITASSLVSIPSGSTVVTATSNSVQLQIAGANAPANSGVSFTFDQVTTPSNMAVGDFVVRTQDAGGNTIEESSTIGGEGCIDLSDCSGHGTCTLLSKVCICDVGWGAPTDVADYKAPDCSTRVCPSNYAWSSIPTSATTGHDILVECSGMGVCQRSAGICMCYDGFDGSMCERMSCPNDCSGRGVCMSMREMAAAKNALPISPPTTYGDERVSGTWDADRIFGCVCDSGWAVGTASGELQATEYFGADCSRRHCPTGDDPDTIVNETDCHNVPVPGGTAVGAAGNACLIECSNRGVCDYRTGSCSCFQGYTGYACQTPDDLAN